MTSTLLRRVVCGSSTACPGKGDWQRGDRHGRQARSGPADGRTQVHAGHRQVPGASPEVHLWAQRGRAERPNRLHFVAEEQTGDAVLAHRQAYRFAVLQSEAVWKESLSISLPSFR